MSKRGLLSLLKSIHYCRGTFSSELSLVILETISSYLLQIKDFVLFWAFLCSLFPFAIFFKCGHYFLNLFPEQGMFHIKVKKTNNNNNREHSFLKPAKLWLRSYQLNLTPSLWESLLLICIQHQEVTRVSSIAHYVQFWETIFSTLETSTCVSNSWVNIYFFLLLEKKVESWEN